MYIWVDSRRFLNSLTFIFFSHCCQGALWNSWQHFCSSTLCLKTSSLPHQLPAQRHSQARTLYAISFSTGFYLSTREMALMTSWPYGQIRPAGVTMVQCLTSVKIYFDNCLLRNIPSTYIKKTNCRNRTTSTQGSLTIARIGVFGGKHFVPMEKKKQIPVHAATRWTIRHGLTS